MKPVGALLDDGEAGGARDDLEIATGGALDDLEIANDCLPDAPMDPVDDDDSDDDGNDGDFVAYEQVTKCRRANSPKSDAAWTGSWSPPTATRNYFEALTAAIPAPAPPMSWDYRPSPAHSRLSEESTEAVNLPRY